MSLESLRNNQSSREAAMEITREEFEKKATELANKYSVSLSEVLQLYASKTNKQIEKHLGNEILLQKIFNDHLLEDVYWDAVEASLQASVVHTNLNQEIEAKNAALAEEISRREIAEKAATMDHLTGLPNRRSLENYLKEKITQYTEGKKSFSVIILDIDDFKGINDKFGHPVGDKVLRKIGEVIHSCLHGTDFAARYGGEEIAVIVDAGGDQAKKLVDRIENAIKEIDPRVVDIDPAIRQQITASFGFAEYDPLTQNTLGQDVLSRADQAMYQNKAFKKKFNT